MFSVLFPQIYSSGNDCKYKELACFMLEKGKLLSKFIPFSLSGTNEIPNFTFE